ncbi:STAS domain-containing protein [Streptomyces sp. NPDC002120]|uniref:STAS domain-containing protein n=1 Tax=Streptomyces sp. NPDC002120 TaxID=3364631 RepID=UPI0036B9C5A9
MAERPSPEAGGNAIAVEVLEHAVAIRPSGEIDIETAPALRFALAEALTHASPAKPVTVDCSRVSFCPPRSTHSSPPGAQHRRPEPSFAWQPPTTSSCASWR